MSPLLDETNWPEALFYYSERMEELLGKLGFERTAHVVEVQRAILRGTFEDEWQEKINFARKQTTVDMLDSSEPAPFDPLVDLCKRIKTKGLADDDKRGYFHIFPIQSFQSDRIWQAGCKLHKAMLDADKGSWFFYEALGLLLEQPECWTPTELAWLLDISFDYLEDKL